MELGEKLETWWHVSIHLRDKCDPIELMIESKTKPDAEIMKAFVIEPEFQLEQKPTRLDGFQVTPIVVPKSVWLWPRDVVTVEAVQTPHNVFQASESQMDEFLANYSRENVYNGKKEVNKNNT